MDLGANHAINEIVLWGRTGCCVLNGYTIYVSDNDISGNNPTANGATSYSQNAAPLPSTTIPINRSGRYVMVRLNSSNFLSMAEVQVFGTAGASSPPNTPTATPTSPPAVNNNALQGVGANSIDVANITLSGDFTIESWVKFSAGQTINNHDGFVTNGLPVNAGGQDLNFWAARFRLYHGGNRIIANTPAVANVWTHYSIVRQNGNLTIYINGLQDATINGSWTAPFVVSEIAGTISGNLHGQLDELRIWSVARSASAIGANYNSEVATNSSGLVGYYKFNDSGTTVTDSAGGDHNGTLNAGTSFVSSTAPLVGASGAFSTIAPKAREDAQSAEIFLPLMSNDTALDATGSSSSVTPTEQEDQREDRSGAVQSKQLFLPLISN